MSKKNWTRNTSHAILVGKYAYYIKNPIRLNGNQNRYSMPGVKDQTVTIDILDFLYTLKIFQQA